MQPPLKPVKTLTKINTYHAGPIPMKTPAQKAPKVTTIKKVAINGSSNTGGRR
jgi:hypothetical protein